MDSQSITQELYLSFHWTAILKIIVVAITTLLIISVIKPLFYTIRDILLWRIIDNNTMTAVNKKRIENMVKYEAILEKQFKDKVILAGNLESEGFAVIGSKEVNPKIAETYDEIKRFLRKSSSEDRVFYESLSKRVDIMLNHFTSDALNNPIKNTYEEYLKIYAAPPKIDFNESTSTEDMQKFIDKL